MNLLPQMRTEDLDEGDFEGGNLAVQENTRQVKLNLMRWSAQASIWSRMGVWTYLETDVDIGAVDSRTPPQRKSSIGDLTQTATLGIREFLELHRLLESRSLLPEQALPRWESRGFEERVLEDGFDTTQRLNNIRSIGIQLEGEISRWTSKLEGCFDSHSTTCHHGVDSSTRTDYSS